MALVNCNECGTEVSDQAKACIKCGAPLAKPKPAPKKKTSLLTWVLLGTIGVVFVGAMGAKNGGGTTTQAKTADQLAKEKLQEVGRKLAGAKVLSLKQQMKDPDSFKLHSADVTNDGTACIEYSGTNSFNARLRGIAVVSADMKTNLSGPDDKRLVEAWNKLCANQQMTDYAAVIEKVLLK